MSRINVCPACNALRNGVKSRIVFEHTCGLERGAVPPIEEDTLSRRELLYGKWSPDEDLNPDDEDDVWPAGT